MIQRYRTRSFQLGQCCLMLMCSCGYACDTVLRILVTFQGVDETDETQFFAYTLGQGLFRSGPQDPGEETELYVLYPATVLYQAAEG